MHLIDSQRVAKRAKLACKTHRIGLQKIPNCNATHTESQRNSACIRKVSIQFS